MLPRGTSDKKLYSNYIFHVILSAFVIHLGQQAGVKFPPNSYWFCTFATTFNFSGCLCSTLLVVSMTFDRFYSIIMPHKAASFNTVKRAKITIVCIYIATLLFNIPQAFLGEGKGYQCTPFAKAGQYSYGMVYYWISFAINYAVPFLLLLSMNSVIIHTLRRRHSNDIGTQGQDQHGKNSSEAQIFAILLLVTFSMLTLNTPAYMFFIYIQLVDITTSPQAFATYYLFYHASFSLQITNYGVNFLLYVISGKKFRADLKKLFKFKTNSNENLVSRKSEP